MKDKIKESILNLITNRDNYSRQKCIELTCKIYNDHISDIKQDIQERINKHEKYYNRVFILKLEEIEFLQSRLNEL